MPAKFLQTFAGIATVWLIASVVNIPVQAGTVGFAYSFAGTDAPPVQSGTTLIIDGSATGSFQTHDSIRNAVWNPVTFQDHCIVDLTTGLLHGTINFAFADGAELFGTEFEDVHELIATNGQGAFTGTLTFTGGTAEFADASGLVSLAGVGTSNGFTESGSGTLTAAGVTTPEPASAVLLFGSLLILAGVRILSRLKSQSQRLGYGKNRRIAWISCIAFTVCFIAGSNLSHADPIAYVVTGTPTGSGQFGAVDLATGAFTPRGGVEPNGYFGMAKGRDGSIYTLTYAGDLKSISSATGFAKEIGATGLGACVLPSSACGPNSELSLGALNGQLYATDFANNLYSVSSTTGVATKLPLTGLPSSPYVLGLRNADGTLDVGDEAIWQSGNHLYLTYDAFVFDPNSGSIVSVAVPPALYQIDPLAGTVSKIGSTDLALDGALELNGTTYVFDDLTSQIKTLDLTTGRTMVVRNFDPSAGLINGAVAATPEPNAGVLLLIGIAGLVAIVGRK